VVRLKLIEELKVNSSLASKYEYYASYLGIDCPARHEQESLDSFASTDQGNVSHKVPAIQAVYKIDVENGQANHTSDFAKVSYPVGELITIKAAQSIQAHCQTILSSKALAYIAIEFLSDPQFRAEVKEEFHKTRGLARDK